MWQRVHYLIICILIALPVFVVAENDFDGDGKSDLAVYVPESSSWYILQSHNGQIWEQQWGWPGVIPISADFDGDNKADIAVYNQSDGTWYIRRSSDGGLWQQHWGWSSTVPVPGDFSGNGVADVTVYDSTMGDWYIRESHTGTLRQQAWGWNATLPVPGDFDGDGITDMAVYHAAAGDWYILQSSNGQVRVCNLGWSATAPVPADYDGDGQTDVAVYYPALGVWYIQQSSNDQLRIENWGWDAVRPVPGDYDGDDRSDLAVYYPANGDWYILKSSDGQLRQQNWGWSAAEPIVPWALRTTPSEHRYDVVIVGGGISGLSAAWHLRDRDILLLEKKDRVGGKAVSGTYGGFTYALGAEYLGQPEGVLAEIIHTLGLQLKEIPEPMDGKYLNGTFYIGEDELDEMMEDYSSASEVQRFKQTFLGYYDEYEEIPDYNPATSALTGLDLISAQQLFNQKSFAAIFTEVYNVYSRGLFGANLNEISAMCSVPEIAYDYYESSSRRRSRAAGAGGSEAYTFLTGLTELTDAMAAHMAASIQVNATVTAVTGTDGSYVVTYQDIHGAMHEIEAQSVVLAVPAPVALSIASSVLSAAQKTILEQIHYSPYATVAFHSAQPIFRSAFDLAMPNGYFLTDLYDSTWVQRYYDPALSNQQQSVVTAYVAPQTYTDRFLLALSDADLVQTLSTNIASVLPGFEGQFTGYEIQRFKYAYPVMTVGAYSRVTQLHQLTRGGLQLAGDYMIYPTFEAAADSGKLAADKIQALFKSKRSTGSD